MIYDPQYSSPQIRGWFQLKHSAQNAPSSYITKFIQRNLEKKPKFYTVINFVKQELGAFSAESSGLNHPLPQIDTTIEFRHRLAW